MPFPAATAARLRLAGLSAASVAAASAAYDAASPPRQQQLRGIIASRPDEVLRRTFGDPADAVDTDPEREALLPARLSPAALRAAFGRPKASALRTFWAALAKAGTSPVDVLCIGTSLTEGADATAPGKRWVELLRDLLRARYQPAGVVGGEGYVPAHYQTPAIPDRFTGAGSLSGYGLGRRSVSLTAGQSRTLTFTGTGCDILYAKGTTTGSFTWAVDGGAASAPISTVDAAGPLGGFAVSVRGLAAASHTLVIAHASGGSAVIEGAMVYNGDETKGIRLWEAGHSGYTTEDYLTTVDNSAKTWAQSIKATNPDLVVIDIGANDEKPAAGITPAQFAINVAALIARVRANCTTDPTIVLVGVWARISTGDGITTEAQWTPYFDALKAAAAADPKVEFLDLWDRFGPNGGAMTLGLLSDQTHVTDAGAWLWAQSAYELVVP